MTIHSEYLDRAELVRRALALHDLGAKHASDGWKEPEALAEALTIAQSLIDSGLFSRRAVARISLLGMGRARANLRPGTGTGGRIEPESLPHILELLRVEDLRSSHAIRPDSVRAVQAAVGAGASLYMLERLSGVPESTLRRWLALEVKDA